MEILVQIYWNSERVKSLVKVWLTWRINENRRRSQDEPTMSAEEGGENEDPCFPGEYFSLLIRVLDPRDPSKKNPPKFYRFFFFIDQNTERKTRTFCFLRILSLFTFNLKFFQCWIVSFRLWIFRNGWFLWSVNYGYVDTDLFLTFSD